MMFSLLKSLSFFFLRDKVFRLKPSLDAHVTLIKDLAKSIKVYHHSHSLYTAVLLQGFRFVDADK